MKVTDCFWELKNIDKTTVEVVVEDNDIFSPDDFLEFQESHQYIVVKVPMCRADYNIGLSELGFTCIETQMRVGFKKFLFDYSKLDKLYNDVEFLEVISDDDLCEVTSKITPGMFSTDRISIDPLFGDNVGCRRYINWLTSEFKSGRSLLLQLLHKKERVGFILFRTEGDKADLLLNGLYKPYQGKGLGLMTPAGVMIYAKKKGLNITDMTTSISSNNTRVVHLYNKLNCQIINQHYVFIKHSSNG